jgi:DNA recombination protein RmuC
MNLPEIFAILLVGIAIGAVAAWLIAKSKFQIVSPVTFEEMNAVRNEKLLIEQRWNDLKSDYESFKNKADKEIAINIELNKEVSTLISVNKNLEEKLLNQQKDLEELHKKMKEQFESIAGKIVLDNSAMIQRQHSEKLFDILNPLKEKIEKFETAVTTNHKENIRENQSLKEQLKMLQDLNKSIGDEARNLTTALKGQVKTQGNWGELILETILEKSGLVKDREYFVQTSITNEDGRRLQPDVLVKLPDNKTIVVDSKVSLIGYERYSSANTPEEKEAALKEHLISVRRHIKGLGEKKYQQLYNVNTLDFVLLFIPIEPAFSTAVQYDNKLFNDAFESNIVVVSPSTLLATLRTISSIWKLEYQNKNSLEIARQGGALYDKFVGFVNDFQKIGDAIGASQKSWDSAFNKLSSGRGNLVTSVEKMKKLGANSTKSIPANFLSDDDITEDDELRSE